MSAGVVVCGTAVGVLWDCVDCCISVPVGDYHRLAQKVLELLNNTNRIDQTRTNAHEWVLKNNIVSAVDKIQRLYSKRS
jgi:hypothetical protein